MPLPSSPKRAVGHFNGCGDVQCQENCLPNADIRERLPILVEKQIGGVVARHGYRIDAGVGGHALYIVGADIIDNVGAADSASMARLEASVMTRKIRFGMWGSPSPVLLVGLQHHAVAGSIGHQLVGPGADGSLEKSPPDSVYAFSLIIEIEGFSSMASCMAYGPSVTILTV